jgi:hypothetical protein
MTIVLNSLVQLSLSLKAQRALLGSSTSDRQLPPSGNLVGSEDRHLDVGSVARSLLGASGTDLLGLGSASHHLVSFSRRTTWGWWMVNVIVGLIPLPILLRNTSLLSDALPRNVLGCDRVGQPIP